MKCHYEVLNISRDADQSEIKTAYRKLALQWHPDKNLDQPEVAKEHFQLVQQAYEVLSDLQERAWYDNHREEILKGAQTNYEDNSLDIFQYFTSTCFKGYDDSPQSFYSVYSEVFSKLASEEIEYLDDPEDYENIPIFGNYQSPYEVVKAFYAYWQSFSTKKSYAWLSPYNINETRDRRVIKLIDKENRKVQQKARRERNEQVRQLVQFVRKRDKRVIAQRKLEEERAQQNKIKAEQMRKEQIRQRNHELSAQVNNSIVMDDLESKLREIEKNLLDEFGNSESDFSEDSDNENQRKEYDQDISDSTEEEENESNKQEDNDMANNLYCVACNKLFKTVSSFENHERSKKHNDQVALLLIEMQNDDADMNDEETINCEHFDSFDSESNNAVLSDAEELLDIKQISSDGEVPQSPISRNKKKQKLKAKLAQTVINSDEEIEILDEFKHNSSDNDNEWECKSRTKVKKSRANVKKKVNSSDQSNINTANTHQDELKNSRMNNKTKVQDKKQDLENDLDTNHICVSCRGKFESKNKLFAHLKSSGHGVALNNKTVTKNKSDKRSRRK